MTLAESHIIVLRYTIPCNIAAENDVECWNAGCVIFSKKATTHCAALKLGNSMGTYTQHLGLVGVD